MAIDDSFVRLHTSWSKEIIRLQERRFVDITHNALGKLCNMYYDLRTRRYEYEPIQK